MNTVLSRPYLPSLGRWRPFVVVSAVLVALVLLALVAALVAGIADNQPTDLLFAPFRWKPDKGIG